jgi:hypothetical protein
MNFHEPDADIVVRLRRWADIYAHHNVSDELLEAAGEIERLRRWKAEATTVLGYWDDAYERSGVPGLPGDSKPKLMADEIIRLRRRIDGLARLLREAETSTLTGDCDGCPNPTDGCPGDCPQRAQDADNLAWWRAQQ